MNELQIFKFNSIKVRTKKTDETVWFCLKDVCNVLAIKNATDVVKRLDEDERTRFNLGRQGEANFINESGLYNVVLRSDKPQAKQFRKWVTSEVLPAIRKTGRYQVPSNPMDALKLMFEAQTQTNETVAKHDLRITELEENKLLNPGEYNYISRAIRNKVKQVKNDLDMDLVQKQTSQIYHAINRDLNCFVGIKTRSQFKAKDFNKALEFIENWQLSYTDKRMIEQMSLDI